LIGREINASLKAGKEGGELRLFVNCTYEGSDYGDWDVTCEALVTVVEGGSTVWWDAHSKPVERCFFFLGFYYFLGSEGGGCLFLTG